MSDIHSCSYFCERPACVLQQRNELRVEMFTSALVLAELKRQADTLFDLARVLRLVERPVIAKACDVAERSAREVIAQAEGGGE